jgi:hypothetical protein
VENTGKGYDFQTLSATMQQLKARFPDKVEAAILAEPDTSYDVLVQTMDAVRAARTARSHVDLFPEISIGDAPVGSGAPAKPGRAS